jgi:hypothetical protein
MIGLADHGQSDGLRLPHGFQLVVGAGGDLVQNDGAAFQAVQGRSTHRAAW